MRRNPKASKFCWVGALGAWRCAWAVSSVETPKKPSIHGRVMEMSLGSQLCRDAKEAKHPRQNEHQGHSDLWYITQIPTLVPSLIPRITASSCHWQRCNVGRERDGQAGSRRGSGLAKAEAASMPKTPSPQASKESSEQVYCCSRRHYFGSGEPRSRHHRKRPGFSIVT